MVVTTISLASCSPAPDEPRAGTDETPAPQYEITGARIPMPDGVQLAADLYWPAGADRSAKYPVLLEYLPYRKERVARSQLCRCIPTSWITATSSLASTSAAPATARA